MTRSGGVAAVALQLNDGRKREVQTEAYNILSGGGTMFTGGHLSAGRKFDLQDLNGPTCIGRAHGATIRAVNLGDVIVISAGVVHGWWDVPEQVVYVSFRPSPGILQPGWINPSCKQLLERACHPAVHLCPESIGQRAP